MCSHARWRLELERKHLDGGNQPRVRARDPRGPHSYGKHETGFDNPREPPPSQRCAQDALRIAYRPPPLAGFTGNGCLLRTVNTSQAA